MSWASAVGSIFSSAGSYAAAERAWKHQKEYSKNAHQWEVEDLKKAGLNPILSAGGSGAPMTTAPMANIENPFSNWSATKTAKKIADADIDNKESSSENFDAQAKQADATAENIIQQTGQERELFQYRKQAEEWKVKKAQQDYINSTIMPDVYRSDIYYKNSAGRGQEVSARRGEAEMPLWETAGEAISTATNWATKKWKEWWNSKDNDNSDYSRNKRSGFIKHLDSGGTVADYKRHNGRGGNY